MSVCQEQEVVCASLHSVTVS